MMDKGMMPLLSSPFSLLVGIYFFRDAVFYVHKKRGMAMLGDFTARSKSYDYSISIQETEQFSKIFVNTPHSANGTVVWIARSQDYEECKQVVDILGLYGIKKNGAMCANVCFATVCSLIIALSLG